MSSAEIPPFETPPPASIDIPKSDIHLRLFVDNDAEHLLKLAQEDAVQRYVPWAKSIHDENSAKEAIGKFKDVWNKRIMARYAIEEDGEFIGYAGIWSDRKPGYYEFGFALLPEVRGQGIGTRTISRLMDTARTNMDAKGMVAYVDDTNEASKAAVTKLGLSPMEEFDDGDRRYELAFDN